MTNLEEIIEDVKNLRGATVSVFGQTTTLKKECSENELIIDVLNVLKNFKPYELEADYYTDYTENEEGEEEEIDILEEDYNVDEAIDKLAEYGIIPDMWEDCNNTYNWCSPISNDINYYIYKDKLYDNILVQLNVHRFGDIRGNYTNDCLLKFDSIQDFYEILSEENRDIDLWVNENNYSCYLNILSDIIEVYDNGGTYLFDVCASDMEELEEEIREKLKNE